MGNLPKILQVAKQDERSTDQGKDWMEQLHHELSEQNWRTLDEATKMLQDQQKEAHHQAVLQWNLKRRERKQLE